MKVAYLLPQFPIPSQAFVVGEILDHIDSGLEVDVISLTPPNADDADLAALGDRAAVSYLDDGSHKTNRLLQFGVAAMAAFGRGSPGLRAALGAGGSLEDRVSTYETLRRRPPALEGYDILHCHFGDAGRFGSVLKSAGLFEGKLLTAFHETDLSRKRSGDLWRRYQGLFAFGDSFLPVSQRWADRLANLGCPPSRIRVQRMGIDAGGVTSAPRATPKAGIQLCGIGPFVEAMGHIYTVRALAAARRLRPDLEISLDLGGDGPMIYEVVTEAEALGLRELVTVHRAPSHEQAMGLMAASDIFVLPAITAADGVRPGIPPVLMEAMAMGLPVISTLHSGIPDLVDDPESGLLVEERDVMGLAWAIVGMAEQPTTWPSLGLAAQTKVRRDHDRRRLGVELRQHYEALLA